MQKQDLPTVVLSDIVAAYWKAMKPQGWLFVIALTGLIIANILSVIVPLYYKEFFDVLTTGGSSDAARMVVLTVLGIHLIQWVSRRVGSHFLNLGESTTIVRIKQQSMAYILEHSQSFFSSTFVGTLTARINRFGNTFERAADTLSYNLIPLIVSAIGTTIVVYTIAPILALVLGLWIVLFVMANYWYSLWRFPSNVLLSELESKTAGTLTDIMSNHSTVGSFYAYGRETERYKEVSDTFAEQQTKVWNTNNIFDAALLFVLIVVEFFVMYLAVGYWAEGAITVGTIVLLQTYVLQIAGKQFDFGRVVRTVFEIRAQGTEALQMLKTPHEVRDASDAIALPPVAGSVTYEQVSYAYDANKTVLSGITVDIPAGQKVALVGPSGAGKSTCVKLLMRTFDPTAGTVRIDGHDIAHVTLASLRESISVVPQEPLLFHRSLMENIRYGRPTATDEEVLEAARSAHCHEFIDQLPEKYESLVGERGVKLSGGERQRVAIARAILKNAPILILDEATSSLDSQSEALIQDALDVLMKGKTVLVIAHRLSTIRKMDRILVVDEGMVKEDGTHDVLLSNPNSLYRALWELQAGGFIVEKDA